jgi:hypothetical protein
MLSKNTNDIGVYISITFVITYGDGVVKILPATYKINSLKDITPNYLLFTLHFLTNTIFSNITLNLVIVSPKSHYNLHVHLQ